MNRNIPSLPHIVIIGAGFGGLAAARELSNQPVRVTVIDSRNYHLFQPLLYQVATAELTASEIAVPIRHILKKARNIEVLLDTVNGIDTERRLISTASGEPVSYDVLIIATGARTSYFGHDKWANLAPGLKSIEDAHLIRNRVLSAFEKAERETDQQRQQTLLTFVIVGGGPTGIELAGAVAEVARNALIHEFRHITPELSRVILIDAGPQILGGFDERLSKRARQDLAKLGVEVLTDTRVANITNDSVQLNGNTIATETVIWAAGVEASPAAHWLGIHTGPGKPVPVDGNMAVKGFDNIYAIGDTAAFIPPGCNRPLPGVASVAKQQGRFVGTYIIARLCEGRLPVFRYRDDGSMVTIGRNKAVVRIRNWRLCGFTGWLLWCIVHIYFLIGFPRRFQVAFNWLWNYFTSQRSVRLIFGIPPSQ